MANTPRQWASFVLFIAAAVVGLAETAESDPTAAASATTLSSTLPTTRRAGQPAITLFVNGTTHTWRDGVGFIVDFTSFGADRTSLRIFETFGPDVPKRLETEVMKHLLDDPDDLPEAVDALVVLKTTVTKAGYKAVGFERMEYREGFLEMPHSTLLRKDGPRQVRYWLNMGELGSDTSEMEFQAFVIDREGVAAQSQAIRVNIH